MCSRKKCLKTLSDKLWYHFHRGPQSYFDSDWTFSHSYLYITIVNKGTLNNMTSFCLFVFCLKKKKGLSVLVYMYSVQPCSGYPFQCVVFLFVPWSYVLVPFPKRCIKLQSRWKKTILESPETQILVQPPPCPAFKAGGTCSLHQGVNQQLPSQSSSACSLSLV